MGISISHLSYPLALSYYSADPAEFRTNVAAKTDLHYRRRFWFDTKLADDKTINTCALRVSYALWSVGVNFSAAECARFYGKQDGRQFELASVAAEYRTILDGATYLKRSGSNVTVESMLVQMQNLQGVILFEGGLGSASGHVTFCKNGKCADKSNFFGRGNQVLFWPMKA